MLITAGVVGATLYFSYKQLNMQRELWVEEHRPKIKTKFNEVTRLNDTIFIANTLINYGLAASDSMSLHLIISDERMTPKRIPMTNQPSLDPDEHYGHSILIKPDVTKYLLDTFYIQMYFEFGWHGSSDRYRYNVNVRLIYDSASSKYQTSVIAKSKIPKRK